MLFRKFIMKTIILLFSKSLGNINLLFKKSLKRAEDSLLKKSKRKVICFFKDKKGTAMVEATIAIPIIFLSLMAVINLEINMYQKIEVQTKHHKEIREEKKEFVSDHVRKIDFVLNITE